MTFGFIVVLVPLSLPDRVSLEPLDLKGSREIVVQLVRMVIQGLMATMARQECQAVTVSRGCLGSL